MMYLSVPNAPPTAGRSRPRPTISEPDTASEVRAPAVLIAIVPTPDRAVP